MFMLALRLFLKEKTGGKQHCLIAFVGSNLGAETFLKKMEHQKTICCNRGLRHLYILCIEVSRKLYVKPVCLLWSNGLAVKALGSQSTGAMFKTIG